MAVCVCFAMLLSQRMQWCRHWGFYTDCLIHFQQFLSVSRMTIIIQYHNIHTFYTPFPIQLRYGLLFSQGSTKCVCLQFRITERDWLWDVLCVQCALNLIRRFPGDRSRKPHQPPDSQLKQTVACTVSPGWSLSLWTAVRVTALSLSSFYSL